MKMKVEIFKRDNGEVFFKFEEDENEYIFSEAGVFKYIDLIIANDYQKIDIIYDENAKELEPYADLLNEIYNDIVKPENRFKETYNKYVVADKKAEESSSSIDCIFNPSNNNE